MDATTSATTTVHALADLGPHSAGSVYSQEAIGTQDTAALFGHRPPKNLFMPHYDKSDERFEAIQDKRLAKSFEKYQQSETFEAVPSRVRFYEGEVFEDGAKVTGFRREDGRDYLKLVVGDKQEGERTMPGVPVAGTAATIGATPPEGGQGFFNAMVEQPLFITVNGGKLGLTLDGDAEDRLPGYQAMALTVPHKQRFAFQPELGEGYTRLASPKNDPLKPPMGVVAYGYERIQIADSEQYLTHAVLAVPVAEDNRPLDSRLLAVREFTTKRDKQMDTTTYIFDATDGALSVTHINGQEGVRLGKRLASEK